MIKVGHIALATSLAVAGSAAAATDAIAPAPNDYRVVFEDQASESETTTLGAYRFTAPRSADAVAAVRDLGLPGFEDAEKGVFSYVTPRIGGVRFGVSYASEDARCLAGLCLEADPLTTLRSPQSIGVDDLYEVDVSYTRHIGDRLAFSATASFARAADASDRNAFNDVSATTAGVSVAYGGFTLGANFLQSNNSWGVEASDVRALDAGVSYERGEWAFMLGYGLATDQAGGEDAESIQTGLNYRFGDRFTIGGGVQFTEQGALVMTPAGRVPAEEDGTTVFLESALNF